MKYAMREYVGKNTDLERLAHTIIEFFREEEFVTQLGEHPKGFFIQAKKGGVFRTILAPDHAFTIVIMGVPSDFKIKIGVGEWIKTLSISALDPFFNTPVSAFVEVPEALWTFELEHYMWFNIETQIDLGFQ